MKLRITIDIFSGRPNPVIELDDADSRAALQRLLPSRALKRAEQRAPADTLGYRGLLIEQVGAGSKKLPKQFRLLNGKLLGENIAHRVGDEEFEDFIFADKQRIQALKVGKGFETYLSKELERYRSLEAAYVPSKEKWPILKKCPCAPIYEPAWWNDGGVRQWNNNCYNYATNYRTDTFAQPGLAAGAMYAALTCPDVWGAAQKDELIPQKIKKIACPKVGHLVALVIAPGWDFHWYRLGPNMRWSHKPGGTPVTNLDNSGHIIPDPRTADRGPYTQFCGFMLVMHGHIKIR
ncbi:MAG: hypothetical protein M3A44_15530 [Gammaproteobacteria bacterium]